MSSGNDQRDDSGPQDSSTTQPGQSSSPSSQEPSVMGRHEPSGQTGPAREEDQSVTDGQRQLDKQWYQRRSTYVGGAVAIGLVSLSVAIGTNSSGETDNNTPPNTEPSASAPIDPTGTPVETPAPELVQRLDSLSAEEFIQRPQTDQLTYAYYRLQERMPRYQEQYAPEMDHENWATSYTEASPRNSDAEIVDSLNYVYQASFLQPDYATDEIYDGDEGKKLLSGMFVKNDPKFNYINVAWYSQNINDEANGGGRNEGIYKIADPNNSQREQANFSCYDDYGTERTCRTIPIRMWNDPAQRVYHMPVILTPFEDTNGAIRYFWLDDQDVLAR